MAETGNTGEGRRLPRPVFESAPAIGAALLSAIVVILVSLPLHSPHDSLMNAGTIAAAAIVVSLPMAGLWVWLAGRSNRVMWFATANVLTLVVAAIAAVLVEQVADLERTVSFVVPLAAIYFGGTTLLAPALERRRVVAVAVTVAALAVVVVLGATLASHGDQPSGHLELPSR